MVEIVDLSPENPQRDLDNIVREISDIIESAWQSDKWFPFSPDGKSVGPLEFMVTYFEESKTKMLTISGSESLNIQIFLTMFADGFWLTTAEKGAKFKYGVVMEGDKDADMNATATDVLPYAKLAKEVIQAVVDWDNPDSRKFAESLYGIDQVRQKVEGLN